MDDPEPMRRHDGVEHLPHQTPGLPEFQRPFDSQNLRKCVAFNPFEDRVRSAILRRTRIDETDDVRMRQPRADRDFAPESIDRLPAALAFIRTMQQLDRNGEIVAETFRRENSTRTARAKLGKNPVAVELDPVDSVGHD